MGSKKRNSSAVEDAEVQEGTGDENGVLKSSKKKVKRKDGEEEVADGSSAPNSVKPMERKKKRKAMDKERRRSASESQEPNPVQVDVEPNASIEGEAQTTTSPRAASVLPEFHISVFKDLASADASVRESAAQVLVTELQEIQKACDRLKDKEVVEGGLKLEAEKDDGLNDCAPSLRYAVRRLIRGVSSSRECARQGFALGLTVLVGTIHSIRIDAFFKLIVDLLEVSSSMKGQEVRDCLLGRLFAYGAMAQSGRLIEEWTSDKDTPYIKDFISLLISLATKKRYLQEPVVSIILDLVEKLPAEALMNHVAESPGLSEWFKEATEVGNPDAFLLALKIREKTCIDSTIFGKMLPNPFSPGQLFTPQHLSIVINCLKESTFCQPRVHGIWPALVNILLPNSSLQSEDAASASKSLKKHKKSRKYNSSEEEIAKNVQCFCETIIDGNLLMSSHDRKHLAFDVLLLVLQNLPASMIQTVLSYKVVQCLMDILSTKNSWLHKVAEYFVKQLLDWVGDDDVRRVSVIVALQKLSYGKFDSITQTRTVKDLVADFKTESGCMLFIQNLMNMFVDESNASEEPSDQSQTTDDNSEIGSVEDKDAVGTNGNSDYLKSWVIESLPCILKYLKLDAEATFRIQKEIMKFLAVQGLFTTSLGSEITSFELREKFRWPQAPTSSALCRMCIEQLQLLLANAQKGEVSRASSNSLELSDLGSFFMRFLGTLRSIPSVSLFRSLNDEDEKAVKNLQVVEASLSREERNCGLGSEAKRLHALRILLIQLLLQVLLKPGECSEAASELIICCKKAFPASDMLEISGEDESAVDATPELMDVLVDTLLSLLPQSSAPMRSAIEQVFKYFCEDITDDGLLRMLRVIKKNLKPARHPGTESEEEDDDDFIDIEEEEKEEIDETETGESDVQADESEAVAQNEVANELATSSDSDEGMDDDKMFEMDKLLSQMFKERKNPSGSETAQSQLVMFKLRILSLLEIFLHENPGKPQVLAVYSKLAQAFVSHHTSDGSEQLGQRIWGILQKQIFKAKDYPRSDAVQLSALESLLAKNLKLASKPFKQKKAASDSSKKAARNRHKMIASLAQNSTFWILKILDARNFSESELQRVFDIFQDVLKGYFDSKKSQIKPEFLREIFRRRAGIGRHLFGFILEKCASSKLEFRRLEALDFVLEILKSYSKEDDQNALKKVIKTHLHKLSQLMTDLVTNMPENKSRRAEVRKFCGRIFQVLSTLNLNESFLDSLTPEASTALESQLCVQFVNFAKLQR